jgi:hypothetical protein
VAALQYESAYLKNNVFLTVERLLSVCGATAFGTTVVRVKETLDRASTVIGPFPIYRSQMILYG